MVRAPELLFLAAEVTKKSQGMTFERWLTLAGFVLSATLGLITLLKFLKERKEARSLQDSASMKAPAEKDGIIVTGAQSAVLVMEQAVKAAREEADRYKADLALSRTDNDALKLIIRELEKNIDELEDKIRALNHTLTMVTRQYEELKKNS